MAKKSKAPSQVGMSAKAEGSQDPADPKGLVILRFVFLLVALGATAMLVASHFNLLHPPGCGAGGGCDQAAKSDYGSIPGMKWPVSFVGFSFYLAMLVSLVVTKGRVSGPMRHMARLGALVSAFYIFILILHRKEYFCAYCLTSHLANFGFLATIELARTLTGVAALQLALRSLTAAAIGFVVATGGLVAGEAFAKKKLEQVGNDSADAVIQKNREKQQQAQAPKETPKETPKEAPKTATSGTVDGELWESRAKRLGLPLDIPETVKPEGFTGRWRIGPEDAPIRIVAFSDYQCPDCKKIEDEVKEILLTRNDVSFSHKHFPFNGDCNPEFKAKYSPHQNACWAARAAETAGILRGNRGFWEMHFWLYARTDAEGKATQGSFTDAELVKGLTDLGYDPVKFQEVMKGAASLQPIADECRQGTELGLMFTPLIYVNGVEFRGWNAPGALKRAVERIAATNPPRGFATEDQPVKAVAKAVEDWRTSFKWSPQQLVRESFPMQHGPENAPVQIIYWGDYEDEYTIAMHKAIMERYGNSPNVLLDFRHYPLHEDCNMFAEREDHTHACRMASVVEAAGRLGGPDAFWKMHVWMMDQNLKYDEEAMKKFAASIGLDTVELIRLAEGEEVKEAVFKDCHQLRNKLGSRFVPAAIVNWRMCPRWKLNDGTIVLSPIFDEVEREAGLKN